MKTLFTIVALCGIMVSQSYAKTVQAIGFQPDTKRTVIGFCTDNLKGSFYTVEPGNMFKCDDVLSREDHLELDQSYTVVTYVGVELYSGCGCLVKVYYYYNDRVDFYVCYNGVSFDPFDVLNEFIGVVK